MGTSTKTIYVVGGTNGVGKSTIRKDLLDSSVPYINADFIAKEMKGGQSSLLLAELAREYGSSQMKKYIAAGESFAFENNLHERKTFEWLRQMQQEGYRIEIYYVGLSDLRITTRRIQERVKRGEHYIPPGEVMARYENGMKLLGYYFSMPDKLVLIDNSKFRQLCMVVKKGISDYKESVPFQWVWKIVLSRDDAETSARAGTFDSIEDIRRAYQSRIRKK